MPHPTGPTDLNTKRLIAQLRKVKEYKGLARDLAKPRRQKAELSLADLGKVKAEKIATAGKVLADGELTRPITLFAWRISKPAAAKIRAAGGKALGLEELIRQKESVKVV